MTGKVMGPDKGCSNVVQQDCSLYSGTIQRGEIQQQYRHTLKRAWESCYNHVRNYPCLETGAGVTVRE